MGPVGPVAYEDDYGRLIRLTTSSDIWEIGSQTPGGTPTLISKAPLSLPLAPQKFVIWRKGYGSKLALLSFSDSEPEGQAAGCLSVIRLSRFQFKSERENRFSTKVSPSFFCQTVWRRLTKVLQTADGVVRHSISSDCQTCLHLILSDCQTCLQLSQVDEFMKKKIKERVMISLYSFSLSLHRLTKYNSKRGWVPTGRLVSLELE